MRNGILIIDKPEGLTSHDVVQLTRRALGMKQVGHSGTLDPLATGVLIMLVGSATKLFNEFSAFDKEYQASITLGQATDTADACGKVISQAPFSHITEEMVQAALKSFFGEINQVPPMVSAVKHKGERLYKLARKGIEVERQPRKITISDIRLIRFDSGQIEFYVRCSKGTYIRQLGEDIAKQLNSCGHISKIARLSIGPFKIKDAIKIGDINESYIRPWQH